MFLVHKISRAKWGPKEGLSAEEISADAVTADLRTQNDSLSFWKCDQASKENLEDVALVIAASGTSVGKLDLIWIASEDVLDDGQTLKNTDGKTPVADLVKRHVDVCRLDYVRLGKVASRIATAIKADKHLHLTKKSVSKLLATAVKQGRIDLSRLEEKVRMEVRKLLGPNISD